MNWCQRWIRARYPARSSRSGSDELVGTSGKGIVLSTRLGAIPGKPTRYSPSEHSSNRFPLGIWRIRFVTGHGHDGRTISTSTWGTVPDPRPHVSEVRPAETRSRLVEPLSHARPRRADQTVIQVHRTDKQSELVSAISEH